MGSINPSFPEDIPLESQWDGSGIPSNFTRLNWTFRWKPGENPIEILVENTGKHHSEYKYVI